MDGYEKHILSAAMSKPAPLGLVDPMVEMREMLAIDPGDTPDDFSHRMEKEVEASHRIRDREELRPMEPESEPVALAMRQISAELAKLRAVIEAWDQNLKNQKF